MTTSQGVLSEFEVPVCPVVGVEQRQVRLDLASEVAVQADERPGSRDREIVLEELLPLDRREAMHAIVEAKLDGVPMMLDLFVLKKDECLYDFSYVAPPSTFERARAEYEQFVTAFATPTRGLGEANE